MTREKMIEALARAIHCHDGRLPTPWDDDMIARWPDDCEYLRKVAMSRAAAVLELVGPKPLVWDGLSMHMTAETPFGKYTIERGYRPDKTMWCGWIFQTHDDGQSVYFNGNDAEGIPEAKAAAQAHADAAHWANTKLGAAHD